MPTFEVRVQNDAGALDTVEVAYTSASAATRALLDAYRRGLDVDASVTVTVRRVEGT